jgi:hypothetical protein
MLGAGLGLLLAHKLSDDQRKGIGWTLAAIGVLSTIPLALMVFGGRDTGFADREDGWQGNG